MPGRSALVPDGAVHLYVPGKRELIDLMVDACFAGFVLDAAATAPADRGPIRAIADANRALYEQHPWLADVSIDRPPLGPGRLRMYELELAALDGLDLSDSETDLALGLVIALVRAHAMSEAAAGSSSDEAAWWVVTGPALARHLNAEDYPLASRVGTAAGERQGRAHDLDLDLDLSYSFSLEPTESRLYGAATAETAPGRETATLRPRAATPPGRARAPRGASRWTAM